MEVVILFLVMGAIAIYVSEVLKRPIIGASLAGGTLIILGIVDMLKSEANGILTVFSGTLMILFSILFNIRRQKYISKRSK